MERRLANGSNGGRDAGGRFLKGCKPGPGNPYARKVARLRAAMLRAVTPADVQAIIATLIDEAKKGNVQAAREVIDRCLGRPVEADLVERIERLEVLVAERER